MQTTFGRLLHGDKWWHRDITQRYLLFWHGSCNPLFCFTNHLSNSKDSCQNIGKHGDAHIKYVAGLFNIGFTWINRLIETIYFHFEIQGIESILSLFNNNFILIDRSWNKEDYKSVLSQHWFYSYWNINGNMHTNLMVWFNGSIHLIKLLLNRHAADFWMLDAKGTKAVQCIWKCCCNAKLWWTVPVTVPMLEC